jgi:coenzyme F420-reducing hydrogenase gamma subunit
MSVTGLAIDPTRGARPELRRGPTQATHRPRVGVIKLASCDGCQLTILDLEDDLLALADRFEFVEFAEATSRRSSGPFDVLFVEGSISTPEQAVEIVRLRAASRLLVTIGACATSGGIQALRTAAEHEAFRAAVYPAPAFVDSLDIATPIADHVVVDAELRGCPISAEQLVEFLTAVATGRRPQLPDQAVCLACKRRGLECVVVTRGEPCLGPVTVTGCGAICPGMGRGCYGCFGPREGANVDSLAEWYATGPTVAGLAAPDVGRLFAGFTGASPAFRAITDRLGGRPPIPLLPATARSPEQADGSPPRWGRAPGPPADLDGQEDFHAHG